jgi:pectate lyase
MNGRRHGDRWLEAVTKFADLVLERCADKYGEQPTPLLVDGIDLDTGEPIEWDGAVLSNLACQQNFLRVLEGLAALTGQEHYQQRAEEWIGFALERLSDRASGMLYWGGHTNFDLRAGEPLLGIHELKCSYPHYPFFYQVDPQATRRCVEGFWHSHVCDWSTLLFNRHGEYAEWDRDACWQAEFKGGPLPIIENLTLSFINTGSDLIYAAVQLYLLTGAPEPLEWAYRLLGRYEQIRNPKTGLAGYQFNHRDPCRVQMAFKPPLNERPEINEMTVIKNGTIEIRYGKAAIVWLNLAAELNAEEGQPFLEMAVRDLTALAEHSYDREKRSFSALLDNGTLLGPDLTVDDVGYCPPYRLVPLPANGLMLLAYARAFRLSGEESLREMAVELAAGSPELAGSEDGACGVIARLELHAATGDQTYLDAARALGERLLEAYPAEQFFTSDRGNATVDGSLPLALLRLAAAGDRASEERLPAFYPRTSEFNPKVIIDRRPKK